MVVVTPARVMHGDGEAGWKPSLLGDIRRRSAAKRAFGDISRRCQLRERAKLMHFYTAALRR
jgi:hypothetical protein